jgi:NADPH:quinone reductase
VSGAPASMRAWRSAEPGLTALALTDVPCPRAGKAEALIRVEAAALNFSDLLMIDDRYQVRPPRPFVPGQEIAGTVVETGAECPLATGERVTGKVDWGGFAGYAVMRGNMAIRIPDGIATATAATLPVVYTTAMVALTECTQVKRGDTVLVLAAAGGVGLASVEIAHALGARVIAAAGDADKGALARAHGADDFIDYRQPGWSKQVSALTDGRGADIIVDPVGGEAAKEALRALAWEGRFLVVGFASGDIPQIPANRLLLKRACAIGVYWNHDRDGAMLERVATRIASMLASGDIRPHIGNTFAFTQLPEALAALAERRTTGKVILAVADKDRSS